jgi:SAM-dependent methyltransferase
MEVSIRVAIESQKRNLAAQLPFLDSLALRPGATILDIGCGPGLACAYFKDRGLVATGVDNWPNIFQYGDQIEFVENVSDLKGRQFDYLLASHVLEHCPNTFQTLAEWRDLLAEDGHIMVIVPPQIPYVANDHWIMGWNVGQLAMTLVAAGFDCRQSHFQRLPLEQVCGWGRKREFPPTRFNIHASLPYLPSAFERNVLCFSGYYIPGDVELADSCEIRERPRNAFHLSIDNDQFENLHSMTISRNQWGDWHGTLPLPTDFRGGIDFICFCKEQSFVGRVAFGTRRDGRDFEHVAEKWLNLKQGLNVVPLAAGDFQTSIGAPDLSCIDHLAFGGTAGDEAGKVELQFALFHASGERAKVKTAQVYGSMPEDTDLANACGIRERLRTNIHLSIDKDHVEDLHRITIPRNQWGGWHGTLDLPADIRAGAELMCFCKEQGFRGRIAIGTRRDGRDFEHVAARWLDLKRGLNVVPLPAREFRTVSGEPDLGRVDQLAFGGTAGAEASEVELQFALFYPSGERMKVNTVQVYDSMPEDADLANACGIRERPRTDIILSIDKDHLEDLHRITIPRDQWGDWHGTLDLPADIRAGVELMCFCKEQGFRGRIAMGTRRDGPYFEHLAERWLELKQGLNVIPLPAREFQITSGEPDLGHVDQLAFGGTAGAEASKVELQFALFHHSGARMNVNTLQVYGSI